VTAPGGTLIKSPKRKYSWCCLQGRLYAAEGTLFPRGPVFPQPASSSLSGSGSFPASRSYTTHLDDRAAGRRTSRSRNRGIRTSATRTHMVRTHKGHTTKDPSRTPSPGPSSRPSRAIRSRSPKVPSPSPNRDPNPNHHPNRIRLSNHQCPGRSPALCLLTGQKSENRLRNFRRYERKDLSARNYRSCRRNATGHR